MIDLDTTPVHQVAGIDVVAGAVSKVRYPFLEGRSSVLPVGVPAVVVVSDLQGRAPPARRRTDEPPLVGTVVAAETARWLRTMRGIDPAACGVILPGDYWSWPPATAKRGGSGDVRPVWDAFADLFRWVVGVPGNHDRFGDPAVAPAACTPWRADVHVLDCSVVELDGLVFGGVGGCVGDPRRAFRFEPRDQESRLLSVLSRRPDVLVVHQGPRGDGRERPGAAGVEDVLLLVERPTLVCCGHEHWETRVTDVGRCRVLNAHEAVCILTASRA